jgi:hypothetical protein
MRHSRRHTHAVDGNQARIVSALRRAGVSVYILGQPLDLLCGRAGVTYLLECKDPEGRDTLEPMQQLFLAEWNGHAKVVRSVDEALAAVGLAKPPKP